MARVVRNSTIQQLSDGSQLPSEDIRHTAFSIPKPDAARLQTPEQVQRYLTDMGNEIRTMTELARSSRPYTIVKDVIFSVSAGFVVKHGVGETPTGYAFENVRVGLPNAYRVANDSSAAASAELDKKQLKFNCTGAFQADVVVYF